MYYYGARYYDPRISIFVSVDPLAEKFTGWTPYHYVHQNPINLIDPTGMSAEGGDGGGWWSKITNGVKSLFSSSNQPETSPIEHTELDEVTVDANRKPNWFQRNFSKHKLSNDWKNIKEKSGFNHFKSYKKDMVGGTGAIRFTGIGYDNLEGEGEIDGITKTIDVGDVSTYSFGNPRILQFVTEGFSKWHSIKGDENIQSWFKPKNDDPRVYHEYKKFGIYGVPYSNRQIIFGYPKDTILRRSEIEQFDKDRQFDSIKLIPLLNK